MHHIFRVDPGTPRWRAYLIHIMIVILVIYPVALVHTQIFLGGFTPELLIGPTLVAFIIGTLWSRSTLLKGQLQVKSEQFRAIADLAQEFTYLRRLDGHYEYVSPSCLGLTGYGQQAFYATPNLMDSLIHPDDQARWMRHVHYINDCGSPEALDLRLIAKDGSVVWFNHICMPIFDEKGRQTGVRSTNLNISERKLNEARIERMAYFDALTDLPNRRSLQRHINNLIHEACDGDREFPVLFLDLDRFKNINDSFGHEFGDRLLRIVAERVERFCGGESVVCRFGGDEFVVVPEHIANIQGVLPFAHQLLDLIEQPIELDEVELHISASVGVAFYPVDGEDAETLIRNADAAMYKTKREGSGNIRIYSAADGREAAHFISTENRIRKGLQQQEFIVHYQPKVEMGSGRIVGMEALARWQHPTQGLIPPSDFIAVAEETGQITQMGRQLLQQVLGDLARWQGAGIRLPVACNVSARQFAELGYDASVIEMLEAAGVAPELLELEVTEQVFLGDLETARDRLLELRRAGISIALDDFGTGFSSFSYLRELPIDCLKIDRSFIRNVDHDRTEAAIIRAIVGMSDELGLKVVVEGVETEGQSRSLQDLGCSIAQGYHYYYPMPLAKLEPLLYRQYDDQLCVTC